MKYVLGIDIGTGSAKAVAVNLASEPIFVCQYHYPTYSLKTGYSEQNPELIWQAFVNCLGDTISKLSESPVAICLSSAMHSLIPVDNTCNHLADMTTWANSRSDDVATRLKESSLGMRMKLRACLCMRYRHCVRSSGSGKMTQNCLTGLINLFQLRNISGTNYSTSSALTIL